MAARPIKKFVKDPDATLDFSVNWTAWLEDDDDSISSVTWTLPSGLTKVSQSNDGAIATAFISGGTAGSRYNVACKIVTAGGRTDERTIEIRVEER